MTKYVDDRRSLTVKRLEVAAGRITDLRDAAAMARLGVDPADAATDWQRALATGYVPASWRVREALQEAGAHGLIDPSRKRPALWNLSLFVWNQDDDPA